MIKKILFLTLALATVAEARPLQTNFLLVSPTVTAGAYATGQDVGGKQTLTGLTCSETNTGIIVSAEIIDLAKNGVAYDLVFFSTNPSSTTFTDNVALTVNDADMSKIVGIVSYATTDAVAFADNGISYKGSLAIPLMSSGQVLYMAVVIRGTATFAATTDVKVRLSFLCDK